MKSNLHENRTVDRLFRATFFAFVFLSGMESAYAQQSNNKVQAAINSIKETYHNEDQDYLTDGQRIVWVKSYKNWMPEDLIIMRKEAPGMFRFLGMLAQRERYDILEQVLPNYYRLRGGAKAFAEDVLLNQIPSQSTDNKKAP